MMLILLKTYDGSDVAVNPSFVTAVKPSRKLDQSWVNMESTYGVLVQGTVEQVTTRLNSAMEALHRAGLD